MDVKNKSEEDKNNDIPKRPRKFVDNNFKTGNEHVEIVKQYTHLGTRLTQTRNLTLALKHLKEKAFFSIRKDTLLNPKTASQIFDTIFLILSYKSSEVWAMYTKQNFKT